MTVKDQRFIDVLRKLPKEFTENLPDDVVSQPYRQKIRSAETDLKAQGLIRDVGQIRQKYSL